MRLHKTPTSLVEGSNVLVPVKGLQMKDQLSQVHTHLFLTHMMLTLGSPKSRGGKGCRKVSTHLYCVSAASWIFLGNTKAIFHREGRMHLYAPLCNRTI